MIKLLTMPELVELLDAPGRLLEYNYRVRVNTKTHWYINELQDNGGYQPILCIAGPDAEAEDIIINREDPSPLLRLSWWCHVLPSQWQEPEPFELNPAYLSGEIPF